MGVQEHHDLADDLLVGPAGGDLPGSLLTDAVDFAQGLWSLLDDVKHRRAEGANKPAGVNRADAFDHAGAEVALNAGKCVRRSIFLTNPLPFTPHPSPLTPVRRCASRENSSSPNLRPLKVLCATATEPG